MAIPGAGAVVSNLAEPLVKKVVKPTLQKIFKNGDEVIEAATKQFPDTVKRFDPSIIDGVKYEIDSGVVEGTKVNKMFEKGELVNIHDTGTKGIDHKVKDINIKNLNDTANKVDPLESTVPKLTTKSEFQATNMPKGKQLIQERQVARELRGQAIELKPGSEDYLSRLSSVGPVNSRQVKLWIQDVRKKAAAGIPREAGGTKFSATGKFEGAEIAGMPYQNLHHEAQKKVFAGYIDQAWKLVDDPLNPATVDDIINLNHIAEEYGIPLGDFGVKPYHKLAHDQSHNTLIKQGVQKTGNELKEQLGTLTGFKNMNELTQDFIKSLEELAVPMQRSMDLHERAYMMIPEADTIRFFQLKGAKDQLTKELRSVYQSATGKKLPDIPTKVKKDGTIVAWISKKTNDPQVVSIAEELQLVRNERDQLGASIKNALPPEIKKDVKGDVDKLERWIENQEQVGIDTGSDEYRLMQGSYEESINPKPSKEDAKLIETSSPKTNKERLENIQKIKAGAPYTNILI